MIYYWTLLANCMYQSGSQSVRLLCVSVISVTEINRSIFVKLNIRLTTEGQPIVIVRTSEV
jgi:hypothetical protein